ncbi:MAG: MBL fold metallo-hydrolase [Clostridiales bacterium]|nr:MBL fold metallo-hydrolase [Clostridiales bacterium]
MIKNIKCFVSGMCETNSYIIYDENLNCVIVDPEGKAKQYVKYINDNGLKPAYIILTHAHFDHIGAMEDLRKELNIDVLAGADEKKTLNDPHINMTDELGKGMSFEADRYLADGEEFTVGSMTFKTLFTPGHTCGSVCFLCESVMIAGDTLFMGSCGRTDFPTGDWAQMTKSLTMLKNLEGDYKVLPGHGPATTLGRERITNMFMR